jgi:hypothetical protein
MKAIRFTHVYDKMLENEHNMPPETAFLIAAFRCKSKDLSEWFVDYNTNYYDPVKGETCHCKLPEGDIIVLLLKSVFNDTYILWTTIRSWTPAKEKYYREAALKHEEFEIVFVTEEVVL